MIPIDAIHDRMRSIRADIRDISGDWPGEASPLDAVASDLDGIIAALDELARLGREAGDRDDPPGPCPAGADVADRWEC